MNDQLELFPEYKEKSMENGKGYGEKPKDNQAILEQAKQEDAVALVRAPRKPRKTSRFLVLKTGTVFKSDADEGAEMSLRIAAEGKSVDGCRNQIKEKKISGNLLIVCVHRTLDVKIQTVETLTGV